MIIQQITINPEITIFLTKLNKEKQELAYRINKYPKMINEERFFPSEDGQLILIGPYKFPIAYLNKFIYENQLT